MTAAVPRDDEGSKKQIGNMCTRVSADASEVKAATASAVTAWTTELAGMPSIRIVIDDDNGVIYPELTDAGYQRLKSLSLDAPAPVANEAAPKKKPRRWKTRERKSR